MPSGIPPRKKGGTRNLKVQIFAKIFFDAYVCMWALRFLGVGVYMSIPSLLSRHHTTRASNNLLLLYMFHILEQTTN